MVKLSEIDKFFLFCYQNKEMEIKYKLDIENKEINDGIFKIMRNNHNGKAVSQSDAIKDGKPNGLYGNFSRFWNLLIKEQQIKYTILSTGKEELYDSNEKIIRYTCEVSNDEYAKKIVRHKFHNYKYDSIDVYYENNDDEFNLRHDLVKYWISLTADFH